MLGSMKGLGSIQQNRKEPNDRAKSSVGAVAQARWKTNQQAEFGAGSKPVALSLGTEGSSARCGASSARYSYSSKCKRYTRPV